MQKFHTLPMKLTILLLFISINVAYSFDWQINSSQLTLSNQQVRGKNLVKSYGLGKDFNYQKYLTLKNQIKNDPNRQVEWVLKNLTTKKIISSYIVGEKVYYGASVVKVMTGLIYLQEKGIPSGEFLQSLLNMIVASDNNDWSIIQSQIADGNSELAKKIMYNRTRELGFNRSRWFRGYLENGLHGNELTILESLYLIEKLYSNEFDFGNIILQIMLTGQKGYDMAKKYLPSHVAIANKGGRYQGKTTNPYNGTKYNEDGTPYVTNVRHQVLIFKDEKNNSDDFALVIHTNEENEEVLSLLAGGLFKEYILSSNSMVNFQL